MRKIVLYVAMSLDGYIADLDGDVAWLSGDGSDPENSGSYSNFLETVDTVILGYNTYHQIITELSPDKWVYEDKNSYVITHNNLPDQKNIKFCNQLYDLISKLKDGSGKDIWVCGGSEIVNELIGCDLIDRFCITIVPTILGNGIHLFSMHKDKIDLKLISSQSYNGYVDLTYEHR